MRAKLMHARPRLRRRRAGLRGRRRLCRHLCRGRVARLRLAVGGESAGRRRRAALLTSRESARRRATRIATAVLRRIARALLRRALLVLWAGLMRLSVIGSGSAVLAVLL